MLTDYTLKMFNRHTGLTKSRWGMFIEIWY